MLNCMFFFLYHLIFILCARDNRSHGVLEGVSQNLVSPNYWYHGKYVIPSYAHNNRYRAYQFRLQQMVSELMMFVQNSSALDQEEDVKSMEFGGGIKMKTTRKFRFILR